MTGVLEVLPAQSEACVIGESKPISWSQAVALAHPSRLQQWSILPHSRVVATHGNARISLWLLADDSVPLDRVILSRRAKRLLGAETGDVATIDIPKRVMLKVIPALVDDLPGAEEVDVSATIASELGGARGMAMLVTEAAAVPVRMRSRRRIEGHVRMSMLTRALVGLAPAREALAAAAAAPRPANIVQLTSLGEWLTRAPRRRATLQWRSWLGSATASARRASRLTAFSIELGLRGLLRAPLVSLRTTEALVGDDTNHVVRIAAPVMPLLGVKAGDQVIVEWERRQALATVLESVRLEPDEQSALRLLQRVDVPAIEGHSAVVLHHLGIGIPAEMRSSLGMPRRTVVTVRRRLLPVFVGRLNELTIPVGGLLLAAATVQGLPIADIMVGIVVVTVLAMLPLRHRTPPRGRWL